MDNNKTNVAGIISFILGALGIVWAFFLPGGCFISLLLGIVAIVLWHRSVAVYGHSPFASLGLVCGIISIVLFLVVLVVLIAVGTGSGVFSSITSM